MQVKKKSKKIKEKNLNKIKHNNMQGITLIALVVTIIVLIILAGVSINLVLENKGIINKAQIASEETKKEAAKEAMNLKITNIQISSYTENQKLPNLQYLADKLCEDNDMEYVLTQSKANASLDKIDVTNLSSIYTKLKEYPYEFEINSSLQLASIDGIKVATSDTTNEDIQVPKSKNLISSMLTYNISDQNKTFSLESFEEYDYLEIITQAYQNVQGKWLGESITRIKISDIVYNTGNNWYDTDDSLYYCICWINNIPISMNIWFKSDEEAHILGFCTNATDVSKIRIKSITALKME